MSEMKTVPLLQTMLNHATTLPPERIQEIRIGWDVYPSNQEQEVFLPKLTILMKD